MNCKPGDLAIIIRSRHLENIGRIVEVVKASSNREGYWLCLSRSTALPATYRDGHCVKSETADAADADLRPVSGLPLDEEQHDEMPTH